MTLWLGTALIGFGIAGVTFRIRGGWAGLIVLGTAICLLDILRRTA